MSSGETPAVGHLTAMEYSFLTPALLGPLYQRGCQLAGLRATPVGWGLLHCTDPDGRHWTVATCDVEYVQLLGAARGTEALSGLTIPAEKFFVVRGGWPTEW